MNGYTQDPSVFERIANLIEQIPQDARLAIVGECIPWDGNPHDMERNLTGYCLRKAWQEVVHPDTTLREIANEIGVTAVHVSNGADLMSDAEWMKEVSVQMADAKDLQETQENARI